MGAMREYSFLETLLLVGIPGEAQFELNGFADGDDVIEAEYAKDAMTDVVGADGEMAVAVSADRSGTIKLKFQQNSRANAQLMLLVERQRTPGLWAPVFIRFQDLNRRDYAGGSLGYIKKPSKMTRGAGINNGEWEIRVARLDMVLGNTMYAGARGAAENF